MRAAILYIYLSFLLLLGVNYLFTATHQSTKSYFCVQNPEGKQQVKHRNTNRHQAIMEADDIDLSEEYHSDEVTKDGNKDIAFSNKLSIANYWYLDLSSFFVLKNSSKRIKNYRLICLESNPIYITQSVFRI